MTDTVRRPGLPRVSREARTALTGICIAVLLMGAAAIRFTSGGTVGANLANATTSTRDFPTFWVIRSGQTLGLISASTGISVVAIEQLNPDADPGELVPGQRIRLRANAAKPPRKP